MDPIEFLGKSRYTYAARVVGEGRYEVVFRWVKWGMERFYKVILTVERRDSIVEYNSTSDSPLEFHMRFEFNPREGRVTAVRVTASMKAGFMANLLGRGDYRVFVEELVERGILGMARRLAETLEVKIGATSPVSCDQCILFDPSRGYCFAVRSGVDNPRSPPCEGKYFISRRGLLEALS